jgi:hypothetical protein
MSVPKFGTTHSTVYGGVPPYGNRDAIPDDVDEQSPVTDIL